MTGQAQNPNSSDSVLTIGKREFVTMMAAIFGLQALGIDIMLPALEQIGSAYNIADANDQQWIVVSFVLGFGFPQLIWGPIADRYGRKILLQCSLVGYAIFGIACMFAPTFEMLLIFRLLQGIACSGTRVSAGAIIRDVSSGRSMARIMSLVFTVFMIVPILAPAFGTVIINTLGWPWTFGALGILAAVVFVWTGTRLPATMKEARPINLASVIDGFRRVLGHRTSFGYMCASGVIFGSLFAFIAASEQVFDEVFERGDMFWAYFAGIAGGLAVMNYLNSKVVEQLGMRRISHTMVLIFILSAAINLSYMYFIGENFWIFYGLFVISFACFGMMGANFASLALEPMGDIAGTANAVYGFFTSTGASLIGLFIAQQFNGTVIPILVGYVSLGIVSLGIILITERGKLFELGAGKT
ncbi:Bcr/CflA family drug resistance efflux transporter [Algimonas ampicilliniresistens]|jgi:DHA1 family bicyclomycin/chloramphenicol resistance-like MFS transporter|uniref:Bcr/CflA family drug resistance efflux transporter n=1 Tax=Algimonas ampicilliniresistens TaxID=1298735 RepID=A0ABQ5V927_9PROT|nr:multidrug effflux MFS transporter [Algimonas ampicilliniresistens]GLQ23091.1 Bcr/CflA family drug resistance efflux transporter [Algimonas ampicilliniresistens]